MLHSKVIFAVVAATCLFQVRGSPAGGKGNDRLMKKVALCCRKSDVEDNNIIEGRLSIRVNDWDNVKVHENRAVTGLGPYPQYMLGTLQEALDSNSIKSLTTALGLDTSTQGAKKTNLRNAFTQVLLGQSQNPQNGVINYETAIIFLNNQAADQGHEITFRIVFQEFMVAAPETAAALKTISYTMMRLKQQNSEDISADRLALRNLIDSAVYAFYGTTDINIESQMAWISLAPFICEITQGNADTANKVVHFLANQSESFKELNKMKPEVQLKLLERVIQGIDKFTKNIKALSKQRE